jgi:hypothetical protein
VIQYFGEAATQLLCSLETIMGFYRLNDDLIIEKLILDLTTRH